MDSVPSRKNVPHLPKMLEGTDWMNYAKTFEVEHFVLDLAGDLYPRDSVRIPFSSFKFPGGEMHIKLDRQLSICSPVTIASRLNSSDDIMLLLLAIDALRNKGAKHISAFLPYFPYARQDRVSVNGEPLSVRVMAQLVNSIGFEEVSIFDPHSDVVSALLNNVCVIDNHAFVRFLFISDASMKQPVFDGLSTVLVAPDAGALKKVAKLAEYLHVPFISASKKRNPKNGELSGAEIYEESLDRNKTYLVVDDICDGGRTFTELGKVLLDHGARKLGLVVSHGIFSSGMDELSKYYDKIYSTNSIGDSVHSIPFSHFLNL